MRMRKPASASVDAEKTRLGLAQAMGQGTDKAIGQGIGNGSAHDLATETVCLALLLALVALVCRIVSIW
jgi:hypothetical protein